MYINYYTAYFSNPQSALQINVILALECTDILLSILCQCRDHLNLVNLVSFSGDVWHSTLNYLHFIKPSSYSLDLERICSPGKHIHSNPKYIQLY